LFGHGHSSTCATVTFRFGQRGLQVKLSILLFALIAVPPAMLGTQACAEDVWTCTQPSATDGKPVQFRYTVSTASNKVYDEFNLPWIIIANDDRELVATMTMSGVQPMVHTLVIDVRTGDMTLSIVNLHATDAPSQLLNGTCVKD
jgi:hypothetical protein